jgi:uncharacterized cupredoxin-like copper-binding protein
MNRLHIVSAIALAALAMSACGSPAPAAAPTLPPEPTALPTETAVQPTAAAASPTQEPAAAAPTTVEITLADNTIASSLTTFQAGVPYKFIVSNHGRREHNFNITPPVSVAGSIDAALNAALLSLDETQLPPGGSASIEFTFPDTAAGAALEFNCLIRRHYDDGMRVDITVTG